MSPGLVPKPLESAVENRATAAGEDGGPEGSRGSLDRGGDHSERGVKERAGELDGRAEPVQRLLDDAEHVCKSDPVGLVARDARGCPSPRERSVRLRAPTTFESTAHNRRGSVVTSDGFAAIECRTKGGARGGEERRAPRGDAGELAFPKDMLDSLSPLAAGATQLGKHRSEGVRSSVPEDAAAQETHSIISYSQHSGALLVVELGNP